MKVPARKFDDEVAAGRIPLDDLGLVWLDVQGHEGEVLAGAEQPPRIEGADRPRVLERDARYRRANHLNETIAERFDVIVDLGWCLCQIASGSSLRR